MAEGLFLHHVTAAGLSDKIQVDSAGTGGWHVGEPADRRMQATAAEHGVQLVSRARQVRLSDFSNFDYIIPMDGSNLHDLQDLAREVGDSGAQLIKMRHFDPMGAGMDVPDPYYGGQKGFEQVFQMLDRSTRGLLRHICEEQGWALPEEV